MLRVAARAQGRRPGLCAAAAAATAGAGRQASGSSTGSADSAARCLYDVLGVEPSATRQELKAAFHQKARVLHPDASPAAGGTPDRAAFVQLLAAYQVLSNPRSRQLYDLSRDRSGPSVLRAAAASGVPGAAGAAYEEVEVDLSWGLGAMFNKPPAGASAALDQVRQELQGELHSAVRRAYLGPKLDAAELGSDCLPDAFEADERAVPDCPDLLQIVSGRQLLGAARERRLHLLARQAAAAALREGQQAQQGVAGLPAGGLAGAAAAAGQQGEAQGPAAQGAPPSCMHAAASPEQQQQQQHAAALQPPEAARQRQRGQQREPDILDLVIGEEVVASAVRHFPLPGDAEGCRSGGRDAAQLDSWRSGTPPGTAQQAAGAAGAAGVAGAGPPPAAAGESVADGQDGHQQQQQQQQGNATHPTLPAEVIGVYDKQGQLLAQVEAQQLDPGSATASSARLLNAGGQHTHTVYRTQTPLVRHLTFAAEPAGTGIRGSVRPSRLVVCRARRAWLPPSTFWLFKPLSYSHDIGGWYLEWAGQSQREHPAWLHPAVLVLTAAFDTLDHERAARQPLGLFARLRGAGPPAGAPDGGSAERQQQQQEERGWRGWLRSAMRFHGRHQRR